jgi:hypothetical protein
MALRIEAAVGAVLIIAGVAQGASYEVRHDHLHGGGTGTLTVTEAGISFKETGKHEDHSREWRWTDIQQLLISPEQVRILTYEDQKWRLGRDREYVFDEIPKDLAAAVLPLAREHIGDRLVEAVPDKLAPVWQAEARLQKKFSATDGTLIVGAGQITFQAKRPEDSRTWRIADVDSITSSGPYDLTITTYERARVSRADRTDFHFQLKERLPDDRYDALWRRVNQAKGLKDLNTLLPTEGEHHHEMQNR